MLRKWRLRTETGEMISEAGDGVCLVDGKLEPESPKAIAFAGAFIRVGDRRLRVAAGRDALTVNGRGAPGGIAILSGRASYTLRVGGVSIAVIPVSVQLAEWSEDSGHCSISGEPLQKGDQVMICPCSMVALAGFARDLGQACPQCGLGWEEAD